MDKRKLYRAMAAIGGVVSLSAVITVSVALVAGPMGGGPAPVEVMTNTVDPMANVDPPESESQESSLIIPEKKEKSPEISSDPAIAALDKFMIPTDWTGKIVRKGGAFYVAAAYEAYIQGSGGYSGELLTVGAAKPEEWPMAGAEQLAQREGAVYYIKLPGTVTYEFGVDTEADRNYFRMQTGLKAALQDYFLV